MKIAVIGTGYVGITTIASLGELGYQLIGVDQDDKKIDQLKKGRLPIYEPGVESVIQSLLKQETLEFTTSVKEAVDKAEVLFITVGTPSVTDGRTNMKYIDAVALEIGRHIKEHRVIVNKSTAPVGTTGRIESIINDQLISREYAVTFDVVSNPEFLQEGKALQGARNPYRIILGCQSLEAAEVMLKLYQKIDVPKQITSPREAEMIKYASNGFLATKITFINEIARLCDRLEVDVTKVAKGVGADKRIGYYFLSAGLGYGGSCFPKDISSLIMMGREAGVEMNLLKIVQEVNQTQTDWFMDKIKETMVDLKGKRIALLGLAFKPDTDDIRDAPSLRLFQRLLKEEAIVAGFDPVANQKVEELDLGISIAQDAYQAVKDADAVAICTEWKEFLHLDWRRIKSLMKGSRIYDGRNALDRDMLKSEGFQYWGVGRN
ncbi:UDP-glucose dehydrogenase family protein [Paenibacillus lautus]|uniref:UDP-glucose dehydrogenase family protein n=1 Tax=Paenibacillus lautus TaxID=1401 RepID=UPI001C116405|nr:UDP-glucose/GDP-mannose dehydrogenase family protein [Paenibacillus lautus]MBU5350617.1 UDP-glucose/GDP-mannose dehydrogenase family protein [Paenibacillus lautus]